MAKDSPTFYDNVSLVQPGSQAQCPCPLLFQPGSQAQCPCPLLSQPGSQAQAPVLPSGKQISDFADVIQKEV